MHREPWQTPEQAEWQANYNKEQARRKRLIADALGLWWMCPSKTCRRAGACLGNEPHECVARFGRAMTDEQRGVLWLYVQARQQGHSVEECERIVSARLAAAGLL